MAPGRPDVTRRQTRQDGPGAARVKGMASWSEEKAKKTATRRFRRVAGRAKDSRILCLTQYQDKVYDPRHETKARETE